MADPPWRFATRSAKGVTRKGAGGHYETMSTDDIMDLPVRDLADRNCVLWLWATHPMKPHALAVMAAWGFTFKTGGVWVKRTRHGKLAFGTGYVLRCASEPFLIGTIGQPRFSRRVRTVIEGPIREHSRKPDEAYREAERLTREPVRRADLFARERRPGWDGWGDEVGKFDVREAAHV
jgi:N6-adenosine-specific RNA methylase IME4